jgi:hypothetical protein
MTALPTVRVVGGSKGSRIINECDFDPARHVLYVEIELPPNPFDHDGDGQPGGSLKGELSTVAKGRRKKAVG